jgi:hypothetical protein
MPGHIRSKRFNEFLTSADTFRVYRGKRILFTSGKDRLAPAVEYIEKFPHKDGVIVYDRIVGNAAALLLQIIGCRTVFSELGSENAIKTLESAGIKYHFNETVNCIMNDSGQDMCPMEKLSLGKNSVEFLKALKERMGGATK